jgi:hypothetical protein
MPRKPANARLGDLLGSAVRLRRPAATAAGRATLPAGTAVAITGEAEQAADGTRWWPVTIIATGRQGWLREEDLEPTANAPS